MAFAAMKSSKRGKLHPAVTQKVTKLWRHVIFPANSAIHQNLVLMEHAHE
jgi:hypothetical protein